MSTPNSTSALRRSLSNLTPSIEIGAAALASLLLLAIAQGATPGHAGAPAPGDPALAMSATGGGADATPGHGVRRSTAHRALRSASMAALTGTRRAQSSLSPIRALFSNCGSADRSTFACGGAQAERPTIQAQLVYRRTLTVCPALDTVMAQGGLQMAIVQAVRTAEDQAVRTGASEPATETLLTKAVQSTLIASGVKPKDALVAVSSIDTAFNDCGGDRAAAAVLAGTASVIRAQLNYDNPAALGGPGVAPIADPRLPSPGNLGTASYASVISGG